MRTVHLALCLAFIGSTVGEYCYSDYHNACKVEVAELPSCNANYSGVHHVMDKLQEYALHHLDHSFQYLFMSTNFATFEKNREGFAKLFRKLSDSSWEDGIDLIKYVTKRGGIMNFDVGYPSEENSAFSGRYDMYELESLSRALDMHKTLAEGAHKIHSEVTKRKSGYHDSETLSYLENEFVHKHANRIRELAGHTNDLTKMLHGIPDPSLSIFIFDEYLQKHF